MENRKRGGVTNSRPNRPESGGVKYRYIKKSTSQIDKESMVFGVQSVLETLRSEKEIDKIDMTNFIFP